MEVLSVAGEVHIDWLSVSQVHPDAPDWGSVRRLDVDPETGELERETLLGDTVEGSWSTALRVRCAGGRVEISGNPSKWGRLDALTGLATLGECLEVYNRVLVELGLPPFRRGWYLRTPEGDYRYDGPRISRVDLTRNLVLGSSRGAATWLDWLEGQRWGKQLRFHRSGASTVQAGGRRRRQHVCYDKSLELRANYKRWARSRSFQREQAKRYLTDLADYCDALGIVRQEIRLGTQWLSENGAYALADNWDDETPSELFRAQMGIETLEAGVMSDYKTGVYDMLTAAGIGAQQASRAQDKFLTWLAGGDWRLGLKQAAQYRYAAMLRKHCGVDILRPCNVQQMSAHVRPVLLEARPLEAGDLPAWYRAA